MDYCILSNTFRFLFYFHCMFALCFYVSTLWLLAVGFMCVATDFLVFIVFHSKDSDSSADGGLAWFLMRPQGCNKLE